MIELGVYGYVDNPDNTMDYKTKLIALEETVRYWKDPIWTEELTYELTSEHGKQDFYVIFNADRFAIVEFPQSFSENSRRTSNYVLFLEPRVTIGSGETYKDSRMIRLSYPMGHIVLVADVESRLIVSIGPLRNVNQ